MLLHMVEKLTADLAVVHTWVLLFGARLDIRAHEMKTGVVGEGEREAAAVFVIMAFNGGAPRDHAIPACMGGWGGGRGPEMMRSYVAKLVDRKLADVHRGITQRWSGRWRRATS
jgi:hypothetical protein